MPSKVNKKRVAFYIASFLTIVGIFVVAGELRHRKDVEVAKAKRELGEARRSISDMGTHGAGREEFLCRPSMHFELHVVQTTCGGVGDMFIEYPIANAMLASVSYSADPGMAYKVDGAFSSTNHSKLSLVQTRAIERLLASKALALNPLGSPDAEQVMPSFPLGIEGCIEGRYFAVERDDHEIDEEFAELWSGIHKTLKTSLERLPDAPPVMCL